MKRLSLVLLAVACAAIPARSLALMVWFLGNPDTIAAYQTGPYVVVVASQNLDTCQTNELIPGPAPFTYKYQLGSLAGLYCPAIHKWEIAAYYTVGSATSVLVQTANGNVSVSVSPMPPTPAPTTP